MHFIRKLSCERVIFQPCYITMFRHPVYPVFEMLDVCRNGNIRARRVKLIKAASSNGVFHGVVCSLKDNYGFIERADIVREIFFHFSEFHDDLQSLTLGDDVQFAVQIRNVSIQ